MTELAPKNVNIPIQYRTAVIDESSINIEDRTVDIVWTTGARRVTFSWEEWGMVEEELDLAGADLSRLNNGAPFLKDHNAWSIDNVLGVHVDGSVTVDAATKQGRAKIRFDTDPEVDKYFKKVVNRILRQTSVGYCVNKYIVTREEGRLPLYRAVEWTPYENSLVTIGADPGAQVQRANSPEPKLFGCNIVYQNRTVTQPKEIKVMAKKIPNQGQPKKRAMTDDTKTKVKDILTAHTMPADQVDAATDEIAALWPEETASGSGEMAAIGKALGCKEGASAADIVKAATNVRALLDATEAELEERQETEEEDEFEVNEKKGLHRKLNLAGENFARELFESNPVLYREKVAKVKPLDQPPPAPKAETRRSLEEHQVIGNDAKLAKAAEAEEKRLLEANPKMTRTEAYAQAVKNVRAKKSA